MKVLVRLKDVYGETRAYPDCETAHLFARMLGTKTLTAHALQHIKALGYEIAVTNAPAPPVGGLATLQLVTA